MSPFDILNPYPYILKGEIFLHKPQLTISAVVVKIFSQQFDLINCKCKYGVTLCTVQEWPVQCTVRQCTVYSDPLSRDLGKSPVPGPALQAARQRPGRHSVLAQSRAQAGKIWRIWPLAAPSQWRGGVCEPLANMVRDTGIFCGDWGNCICSGGTRILILSPWAANVTVWSLDTRASCERDIMTF